MSELLPATQRSAWLIRPGTVEVREVPLSPPGPGQVLVKIERALAGGTDLKAFVRGHPQIPMPGPFGHRYAGSVAAVGPGAPPFAVGQPVMGVHSAPCLTCRLCRTRRQSLCPDVMREKVLGAFGQYLCVPAAVARQNLFARPAHLPAERAALLEPLACVAHALDLIDWRDAENVLVLGLGAMGLLFAQALPRYTAARRAGLGRRPARQELARKYGLEPDDGGAYDVVIECTGKMDGWKSADERAAPGGQVMLFGGLPRGTSYEADTYRLHYEEVRLIGSFHFGPADVARARDWLAEGAVVGDGLIEGTVPLSGVAGALERLKAGDAIQYAIDPWA